MDLNHDLLSQSQVCCRYTNPVYGDPRGAQARNEGTVSARLTGRILFYAITLI